MEIVGTGQQGKCVKQLLYKQGIGESRAFKHGKYITEEGNVTRAVKS